MNQCDPGRETGRSSMADRDDPGLGGWVNRKIRPQITAAASLGYAREENGRAGGQGETARQSTIDSSRRVCARRNGPHPRGQTWGTFYQAGDCDRSFQGAAGRGEAATASERNGARENQTTGQTRIRASGQRRWPSIIAKA